MRMLLSAAALVLVLAGCDSATDIPDAPALSVEARIARPPDVPFPTVRM